MRARALAGPLAAGLVVGVCLTLAHGLLPERWAVLAGTSALWGVAPMVVARVAAARRSDPATTAGTTAAGATAAGAAVAGATATGATAGLLTMAGTLLPWLVVHATSTPGVEIAMWLVAGAVAGAICGVAGAVSSGHGIRGAVAAGAVPGIVAGEAVYGLVVVGGPAWLLELVIAAVLVAATSRSGSRITSLVSAAAFLATVAVACVGYDAVLS